MSFTSGLFARMLFAIFCSSTVLPVRGGATMSPRCPLPIGVTRSTIRVEKSAGSRSSTSRWVGKYGVRLLNGMISFLRSGESLLIVSTFSIAKKRSFSRGVRICPAT